MRKDGEERREADVDHRVSQREDGDRKKGCEVEAKNTRVSSWWINRETVEEDDRACDQETKTWDESKEGSNVFETRDDAPKCVEDPVSDEDGTQVTCVEGRDVIGEDVDCHVVVGPIGGLVDAKVDHHQEAQDRQVRDETQEDDEQDRGLTENEIESAQRALELDKLCVFLFHLLLLCDPLCFFQSIRFLFDGA